MKVAVVGATGLVGNKIIETLYKRKFPVSQLIPAASEKSAGNIIYCNNQPHTVVTVEEALKQKPDIALFSAGGTVSLEWAPKFAAIKTKVIDNSSAFRMQKNIKLIVPEVNAAVLKKDDYIIANPNCSTIQMVMVLSPLHKKFTIKRVVVSTYQSVTGTGKKAVDQLMNERKNFQGEMAYKYPIDLNVIPQIDVFSDDGYTKEEWKMINETKKILDDDSIAVTATTVRIPVIGGHSESVNIEFEKPFELDAIKKILGETKGVIVEDDIENQIYPMPLNAKDKDEVFVGRIRRDNTVNNGLNVWIVSDNLCKGAATNAVQIAEHLMNNNLI